MFVLLFGLMGVASIFPVGNHHAGKGDQYDRGAAMTEAAFGELHARGMLRPQYWMYPNNTPTSVMVQSTPNEWTFTNAFPPTSSQPGPGYAFVLDPLGAAGVSSDVFPRTAIDLGASFPDPDPPEPGNEGFSGTGGLLGNRFPLRRITLADANGKMSIPVAETIFRLRDDLTNELPKESDRPGIQRWRTDASGNLLQRGYAGSYSWLATIVPTSRSGVADLLPSNGMTGSSLYEVSVAVFYKRNIASSADSERSILVTLSSGGEMKEMIANGAPPVVDKAFEDIRSGQWIALAGVRRGSGTGDGQFVLKWYRLLSLDAETEGNQRRAMLDGPDWPGDLANVRAILLPGIINVSTQVVTMERE